MNKLKKQNNDFDGENDSLRLELRQTKMSLELLQDELKVSQLKLGKEIEQLEAKIGQLKTENEWLEEEKRKLTLESKNVLDMTQKLQKSFDEADKENIRVNCMLELKESELSTVAAELKKTRETLIERLLGTGLGKCRQD